MFFVFKTRKLEGRNFFLYCIGAAIGKAPGLKATPVQTVQVSQLRLIDLES